MGRSLSVMLGLMKSRLLGVRHSIASRDQSLKELVARNAYIEHVRLMMGRQIGEQITKSMDTPIEYEGYTDTYYIGAEIVWLTRAEFNELMDAFMGRGAAPQEPRPRRQDEGIVPDVPAPNMEKLRKSILEQLSKDDDTSAPRRLK
jgi:hypothetical protein